MIKCLSILMLCTVCISTRAEDCLFVSGAGDPVVDGVYYSTTISGHPVYVATGKRIIAQIPIYGDDCWVLLVNDQIRYQSYDDLEENAWRISGGGGKYPPPSVTPQKPREGS